MVEAVRLIVEPTQRGLLLDAVGAAGIALTTTVVVPAGPVHPATVAVTEYVPALAATEVAIDGFCVEAVKPFGPVQL